MGCRGVGRPAWSGQDADRPRVSTLCVAVHFPFSPKEWEWEMQGWEGASSNLLDLSVQVTATPFLRG